MAEHDQSVYAVQEAIIVTNSLAIHSRSPYLVKYYKFLTRNLINLLVTLRKAPANPTKTWYELLKMHNSN